MSYQKPSWTKKQIERLKTLSKKKNVLIAYCCSDQHGRSANSGTSKSVKSGMIQEQSGELKICHNGFHATLAPHRWNGCRVWMVALHGEMQNAGDKYCAMKREILGEIMPEDCIDAQVGARIGRKDLSFANLSCADLSGANLYCANLYHADLSGAYLFGAYLFGAYLSCADLSGANLYCANLYHANLSGARVNEYTKITLPEKYEVSKNGIVVEKA